LRSFSVLPAGKQGEADCEGRRPSRHSQAMRPSGKI
jgi:hypothetical protein